MINNVPYYKWIYHVFNLQIIKKAINYLVKIILNKKKRSMLLKWKGNAIRFCAFLYFNKLVVYSTGSIRHPRSFVCCIVYLLYFKRFYLAWAFC